LLVRIRSGQPAGEIAGALPFLSIRAGPRRASGRPGRAANAKLRLFFCFRRAKDYA
jgi:hypothetical protein